MRARLLIGILSATFVTLANQASAEILVQEDFQGVAPYGFEGQYTGEGGSQWYEETVDGWSGTGSHLVVRENARQFNLGWYGGTGRNWQAGDIVYVRFRIRFDDDWRWDGEGSMQNKMMEMGIGNGGDSRFILHNEKPHSTTPCGLPDSVNNGMVGGFSLKKGITSECTPPVMVGPGEWYHIQIAVRASTVGGRDGFFKVWLNNNDQNDPSSQLANTTVTATMWGQYAIGAFFTDAAYYRDQGWVIDDFVVATHFDANWAPDGSSPTPPPPPAPPPPDPDPVNPTGLPVSMDFETGDFSQFNASAFSQLPDLVSNDCAGGAYCARADLVQGTNSDYYVNHNIGDMPNIGLQKIEEMYFALDSRFSPDYVWPVNTQKIAILNLTDGVDTQRRYQAILAVWENGDYGVELSDIGDWRFTPLFQNVGTGTVGPTGGTWDRLKVYVRLNTPGQSDGVVRMWVDGVLKLDYQNLNIRENTDYGIGRFILSSYATQSSPVNGLQWADNVVLSEIDPDGMRPEPPVAFRVE